MIMIIAIIYIFLSYVIFDQQLKITFRKSSAKKIHSPLFTHAPLKIQKLQVPPFCQHWKFFRSPLQKRRRTLCLLSIINVDRKYLYVLYFSWNLAFTCGSFLPMNLFNSFLLIEIDFWIPNVIQGFALNFSIYLLFFFKRGIPNK